MYRLLTSLIPIHVQFWAAPHHSMDVFANNLGSICGDRSAMKLKVHSPESPRDIPPAPPARPVTPVPTDVPVPEPHDIPIPEPIELPPPEPDVIPPGAKPPKHTGNDPQPRPVP